MALTGPELPPFVLFYASVVLAAAFGGLGPGLLATAASAAVAWTWLLPAQPVHAEEARLALFVALGALVSVVAGGFRLARRRRADRDRSQAAGVEEKLRRAMAMLRAIADTTQDPMYVKDSEGRMLFANPATLRALGRPAEQVIGRTDAEVLGATIGGALRATDLRIMEAGVAEVVEEEVEGPEGRRLFLSTKSPYRDDQGRIVGIIGVSRDITERKRAEEARRTLERDAARGESEVKFRALIENSSDMIVVFDAGGAIRFWSPGATAALGWLAEEVLGRAGPELTHPEDAERGGRAFREILATPVATSRVTTRIRHKDGSWRQVESVARNLLEEPAVKGVVVNARDVTDQLRLQQQFLEAQKLESIGRLAGGVAHDFNNLLTAILGGAEALLQHLDRGKPIDREDVESILQAGGRSRDLTRRLLAVARRQVFAPAPVDLNDLVRETEKLLRRLLPESIALAVSLQPDLWTVGDRSQLQQVLMNLAVNAKDAMPGGGRLVIETANADLDEGASRSPGAAPKPRARLTVRDSGSGIPPEVREHLFEPFFTTKSRGQGTGLGLATVYGIVQQSNGSIAVESEPGRGAAFHIYLPRSTPGVAKPPPESKAEPGGSETILVVEDEPLVREMAVRALRRAGYRVLVADGADEALAVEAAADGAFDLLLTDVVMPGLNGRELAEGLLRRHPDLRVLYVSGYTEDAFDGVGSPEDGLELLPKPFTASGLLARVRQVLDRSPPAREDD
jgi:PAS domain S-box-containing protein